LSSIKLARAAIMAFYLALCALYNVTLPIFEASDEVAHYSYAAYLAREQRLPDLRSPHAPATHEAAQPPLYYALAALVISPIDQSALERISKFNTDWFDRELNPDFVSVVNLHLHTDAENFPYAGAVWGVRALRALSSMLGALTVLCVFGIARIVAHGDDTAALLAMALTALNPKFVHVSSIVSNDIALIGAASAACWLICRQLARPNTAESALRALFALGLCIGAAVLSKLGGLALFAPAALCVLHTSPATLIKRTLALLAGFLLVSGAWFAFNMLTYGDPLAFSQVRTANAPMLRATPLDLPALLGTLPEIGLSYFGVIGLGLRLPQWALAVWAIVIAAGAFGAAMLALRQLRTINGTWLRSPWAALLLWHTGLLALFVPWLRGYVATENGRLIMPGIAVLATALALGLLRWLPARATAPIAAVTVLGLAGIAGSAPFHTIQPAFAAPPLLDESAARGLLSQQGAGGSFEGRIKVLNSGLSSTRLDEGEALKVDLVWGALQPLDQSHRVIIEALDESGKPLARRYAIPFAGRYSTLRWEAGRYFADQYTLQIPPQTRRTVARITLSLYRPYGEPGLLMLDGGGTALTLGRVRMAPADETRTPAAAAPAMATFGDAIALTRVSRAADSLTFTWRVLQRPAADYTFFIHALDAQGVQIAHQDAQPFDNGQYPTGLWDAGEELDDKRTFVLPAGAQQLRIGWYDPAQGNARLAALRADGARWQDDIVLLDVAQLTP
jgi:hypothetical protein